MRLCYHACEFFKSHSYRKLLLGGCGVFFLSNRIQVNPMWSPCQTKPPPTWKKWRKLVTLNKTWSFRWSVLVHVGSSWFRCIDWFSTLYNIYIYYIILIVYHIYDMRYDPIMIYKLCNYTNFVAKTWTYHLYVSPIFFIICCIPFEKRKKQFVLAMPRNLAICGAVILVVIFALVPNPRIAIWVSWWTRISRKANGGKEELNEKSRIQLNQ